MKSTGAGLACLGSRYAVVWLANTLGNVEGIKAGEVILSGALGPVILLKGDHIEARISGLGNVSCRFDEEEWRK